MDGGLRPRGLMFCPVQHVGRLKTTLRPWPTDIWWIFKIRTLGDSGFPDTPSTSATNSAGTHSLAPSLGQHTIEVMKELGYSDQEIEMLKGDGVIR